MDAVAPEDAEIPFLEGQADAFFAVDGAWRLVYVSRRAAEVLGDSPPGLRGRTVWDALPEGAVDECYGHFYRALAENTAAGFEVRLGGGAGWFDVHAFPAGTGLAVWLSDATERRRAEVGLREREQQFRLLVENAADVIVILDAGGSIRYESPAVQRELGYAPGERHGSGFFEYVHPDDTPDIIDAFSRVIDEKRHTAELTVRMRAAGGAWRTVEVRARNLLHHPAVNGIVATCRDVTVQHDAPHRGRGDGQDRVGQDRKLEAVRRIAGGVAHDFNNLLTAIRGHADMLLAETEGDAAGRESLDEIRAAAERAAALTRQLLAFSRQQVLQPIRIALNTVVADMEAELRDLAGDGVELVTKLDPAAGFVHADPAQIRQVIRNLVANARDAMPEGGRITVSTGTVRLADDDLHRESGLAPGSYAVVAVADTGVGMDTETLERAFEPFFTTREHGSAAGLGLSTAYGIARQSGGSINAHSAPGRGSTFQVLLPAAAEPDAEQPGAPGTTRSDNPPDTPGTILVADDEPAVRSLVRKVLRRRGYHILEADSADTALRLSRDHDAAIHLLVTDLVMPGTGGRELAESITAQRPGTRILFISGYTDDEALRTGGLPAGAAFLQKPFSPDQLVNAVKDMLEQRQ